MSKEEILDKHATISLYTNDKRLDYWIGLAMEEYAKEVAIKFREWQDENTEGKIWENYDGHDRWYNGHTREVIETFELFNRFLKQVKL